MAPPKVYGWAISPFVSRALLALEEAGVDYELVPMSRQAGDHRRPEHLARNPFGQVPVLEDGDLTLFESRAIARHVFRKHKPELLGAGSLERSAMVDVWLEVEAHQLHPAAGAVVVECVFVPLLGRPRNQAAIDENVEKLKKVLEVYEARLAQSRYLAGDFISIADLSHFTMLHYFMATEHAALVEALPHVRAWWEDLAARPAARKVAELMPLDLGRAIQWYPSIHLQLDILDCGLDLWPPVVGPGTASQFADLQLHILDRGFDLGTPLVERRGRSLKALDTISMALLEILEPLLPLEVVLVELVKEKFGVGIHGAGATLETGKVVMWGDGDPESSLWYQDVSYKELEQNRGRSKNKERLARIRQNEE